MVASFMDQLLPVLEVEGSILVELFTDGGDAEIGRRLAAEVRLVRQQQRRDVWFLGKTLVASAGVTNNGSVSEGETEGDPGHGTADPRSQDDKGSASRRAIGKLPAGARGDDCRYRPRVTPRRTRLRRTDRRLECRCR